MTDRIGIKNLLGFQGADTRTCRITSIKNGTAVGEQTLTITNGPDGPAYNLEYVSGGGFDYTRNRDQVLDYLNANPSTAGCPTSFFPASSGTTVYEVRGEQTAQDTQSSGIYEFFPMIAAILSVSVLILLVMKGTWLGKKSIETFTGETDNEDSKYYYVGANGKEYWGIKNRHRR